LPEPYNFSFPGIGPTEDGEDSFRHPIPYKGDSREPPFFFYIYFVVDNDGLGITY